MLALGGITAVLGVLYARTQNHLKRLLAYHTVENIGIIFIGVGFSNVFRATAGGSRTRAHPAALFHVLRDSVFFIFMFFLAGSVY